MKKFIAWALAALLIVPVSCNKGNENKMDEPATKALAQVITFNTPAVLGAFGLKSIELSEAGRYIVLLQSSVKAVASSDDLVIYGTYTYTNGTFNLDGFGHVTINGNQVTITTETAGGSPVTATATIKPTTTSDTPHDNLCRNWKIGKTIIGISGGSFGQAGAEKVFNSGINMNEIITWTEDYISLSAQEKADLLKYSVQEVCITGAGSLAVAFSQADPFVGTYSLTSTNISFGFDVNDIPFVKNGKFTGTVTFEGSTCKVTAKASMTHNDQDYNATLEMVLTEVK
jgi:hypothetical protein